MDLFKIKKIYMIGIKGVGMTMLAQFFSKKGIKVIGSDTEKKFMTDKVLKKERIKFFENFNKKNIPEDTELIIYSTAYTAENNPEVAEALKSKIKTLTYAQALSEVFNQKYGIAIVGSHGKTTTSAWLGYVMERAGMEPNVMVGANVPQFNGNTVVGDSDYLVIEADEYQNKLKFFNPKVVLLNNIDYDHPDFFKTKEDYTDVFIHFIKKIPKKGLLIANFDDNIIKKIANNNCSGKLVGYGMEEGEANFLAHEIKYSNQKQYFKIKMKNGNENSAQDLGNFSIQLQGKHNIYNALAVVATSVELGIELSKIRQHLEEFKGTDRRMQILGKFNNALIIDDYAHHPTEISATLEGAKQAYPKNKIIVVFHPHTFTRTKTLLKQFSQSFTKAKQIIVLDIYGSAREERGGVDSAELVQKIKNYNKQNNFKQKVDYIPTLKETEKYLRKNIKKNDIVILMGAGDVFRIGENLINKD